MTTKQKTFRELHTEIICSINKALHSGMPQAEVYGVVCAIKLDGEMAIKTEAEYRKRKNVLVGEQS